MQFQVPQFIDTEAKIVGPLTLKQFLILAGAGGVSILCFYIFQLWLWLLITAMVGGVAVGIAFIKINGRSLMLLFKSMVRYFMEPKFYLWQRTAPAASAPEFPDLPKRSGSGTLDSLLLKLTTTTQAITKREFHNPLARLKGGAGTPSEEGVEVVRRNTGEREAAKRVDYR